MLIAKCKKCGKKYELGPIEKPSDFRCECGGELTSNETLKESLEKSNKKKPKLICSNMKCKNIEDIEGKYCPECGSEIVERDSNLIFAKLNCPSEPTKYNKQKPKGYVSFKPNLLKQKRIVNKKGKVHDRYWRIVQGNSRQEFYEKIEKWENSGYELIPESLSTTLSGGIGGSVSHIGLGVTIMTYSAFMRKRTMNVFI